MSLAKALLISVFSSENLYLFSSVGHIQVGDYTTHACSKVFVHMLSQIHLYLLLHFCLWTWKLIIKPHKQHTNLTLYGESSYGKKCCQFLTAIFNLQLFNVTCFSKVNLVFTVYTHSTVYII